MSKRANSDEPRTASKAAAGESSISKGSDGRTVTDEWDGCGGVIEGGRSDRRFCSNGCRQLAYRRRKHEADVERRGLEALATMFALFRDADSRNAAAGASRNATEDQS